MRRVNIIGCPGAGKSTFARKLSEKTGLELFYLDMIWHKPDKTTVARDEFDLRLNEIFERDTWIIDGNYLRTMERRLSECDTVFFFDLPTEVCLEGAASRVGKKREDMPWVETEVDEDFLRRILDFEKDQKPKIHEYLEKIKSENEIIIFKSHREADDFIASLA